MDLDLEDSREDERAAIAMTFGNSDEDRETSKVCQGYAVYTKVIESKFRRR
jgi:hypothetical protein